jgi:hypothetical protein
VNENVNGKKQLYPGLAYNFITLLGAATALFGLAAIVILYLLNMFSGGTNPYIGIFIYMVFPAVLVVGLLLIPLGMWREKKRRERGKQRPVVVDLGNPHHRNAVITFVAGTCVFLLVTTIGLYQGYQYTESVEFCGETCHTVMQPEHTAYLRSAHARVECVNCHIGPGAGWYVRSKLSGVRQVFKTILHTYPTPIETPIKNLRPAQETCEQCHWPAKFYPASEETHDHYLADKENTHWRIKMLFKVGGTSASSQGHASGIHWHIDKDNHMTYVSTDSSRQAFDQVTWMKGGKEIVFSKTGEPLPDSVMAERQAKGWVRRLDCIDCHNRPSHNYLSPMEAVNTAMAAGVLSPSIPWIKTEAVTALSRDYATEEGAMDSISASMKEFYAGKNIDLPSEAITAVQGIYNQNMFPAMKVRWDEYPDNRGHFLFPGCFRCHGSELRNADGERISSDCKLCHTIIGQGLAKDLGDTVNTAGLEFKHPVDIDGAWKEMHCYDCHSGDDSIY